MTTVPGRDPVTAISEAGAIGLVAEIFADIRSVMRIPLITSIWRTLADIEGGLEAAWAVTRPIYETGQPDAALQNLKAQKPFPSLAPLAPGQLESVGVSNDDLPVVRGIVGAYSRSNGMNLIALTALVTDPKGEPATYPIPPPPDRWPELPALLAQSEINAETWGILQQIKHLGATGHDSALATLWRHLAHWPGLLSLIITSYDSSQRDGTLLEARQHVMDLARLEAEAIAHLKPANIDMPTEARQMIERYVGSPANVNRLVTLGHGVAEWLSDTD
jgi:hypothetical protein